MPKEREPQPAKPATARAGEDLADLPDTEEEFPTQGEQVSGPPAEGDEPDTAGKLGPMAVETADALRRQEKAREEQQD